MEQRNYSHEIVWLLLRGKNHARGLARILLTNHMNVNRKIRALLKDNVVDFCQEGKNKSYFLKQTPEARACVFMAESARLIQLLKRYPGLRRIIERIQQDKRIKLALIFGSYSKGIATEDSDIDIYLDSTELQLKKDLSMYDTKLSVKLGIYDPESKLIKEIEKNHVIIKGIEAYYEKNHLLG